VADGARILGKFRDGRPIYADQVDKTVELIQANPEYRGAILKKMGVEAELSEVEQLRREIAARDQRELREKIAGKYKLPEELAESLTGTTPGEIEESAKKLAAWRDKELEAAKAGAQTRDTDHRPAFIPPMNGGVGKPRTAAEIAAEVKSKW
jgi:hypothetical protein